MLTFKLIAIVSLFAAQAGASKVIAIEASEKMAGVATQVKFLLSVDLLLIFVPHLLVFAAHFLSPLLNSPLSPSCLITADCNRQWPLAEWETRWM